MDSRLQAVKDFVIHLLGCQCPEEAFRDIRLNRAPDALAGVPLLFEIRVGGRLLIFGVAADHLEGSAAALASLVAAGAKARDDLRYNRFRLVAVSEDAAGTLLRQRFAELAGLDDRVHLHVVRMEDIRGFMDA